MKNKDIIDAWATIRTENHSIPDDVLDFMKDSAIEKLSEIPSNGGEGESEKMVEGFVLSHRHNRYLKLDKDADRDKIKMLIDIITESWSSQPTKEFSRDDVTDIIEKIGQKMEADSWFKYDNKTGKWFVHTKGHLSSSELLTKFLNNTKQ